MYAIVKTGGKQVRLAPGDVVRVEKLEAEVGSVVELGDVLLVADGDQVTVGRPAVQGAKVLAEVVSHGRGDKLIVFKKKRRKDFRRKAGHRQWYTELRVQDIATE